MNIEEILNTMDYGTAPEDTSPALKWLDAREWTIKPFINGEFVDNDAPIYFDTINPATGER
jgi:aldehyde dehydrogenase (NAD+)